MEDDISGQEWLTDAGDLDIVWDEWLNEFSETGAIITDIVENGEDTNADVDDGKSNKKKGKGAKRKSKQQHALKGKQSSGDYEKARRKRLNSAARMTAYRELCTHVAAAAADDGECAEANGNDSMAAFRPELEIIPQNIGQLFNAFNSGMIENVVKCITASFAENCMLRTRLVKFGDFVPFADRELTGRDNVIYYFRAFFDCYPDGVWSIDSNHMKKKGFASIVNNFTFTGTVLKSVFDIHDKIVPPLDPKAQEDVNSRRPDTMTMNISGTIVAKFNDVGQIACYHIIYIPRMASTQFDGLA